MNLPNKLTLLRCIMTPVFFVLLLSFFPYNYLVALAVFVIASLTDYLDGQIARKRGLVTNLGKFLDPLADKMLTTAAFIGFTKVISGRQVALALFLILAREFMVTSVRLLAAKDGVVVAASFFGKLKTVMQMVTIVYILLLLQANQLQTMYTSIAAWMPIGNLIGKSFLWVTVAATVVSGIQYVWNLRGYFKEEKA